MRVAHLSLSDFRNYRTAEVPFSPGLNLIIGRNGQGKTNLVEAIAYFASLGSHRVTGESAMIRAGSDAAIARMRIGVGNREALLEVQMNRDRPNRAQVNRNSVKPRELTRWFSVVVFAPEDLTIVRGEPSLRRAFIDEACIARNPAFAGILADYERVVRQRTSLLKSARVSGNRSSLDATLGVWDAQLVELGARVMHERRALVLALAGPLERSYQELVEQDHHPAISLSESILRTIDQHVSRETSVPGGVGARSQQSSSSSGQESDVSRETLIAQFTSAIESVRAQELDRGMTLVGPHRDDVHLELNGLPVKGYASHGETWSFALSLRLGLASLLREESPAGDPVIILDDVFAELDTRRRARLIRAVSGFEQVVVTAAVEEDVPVSSTWHRIRVESGKVSGIDEVSPGVERSDIAGAFSSGEPNPEVSDEGR